MQNLHKYIENNITDQNISYRGGFIKVDISGLLSQTSLQALENAGENAIAGTSQNYLGGGIAGRITTGRQFDINLLTKKDQAVYDQFCKACIEYHYTQNEGGGDEYMVENVNTLEKNQNLSVSGY